MDIPGTSKRKSILIVTLVLFCHLTLLSCQTPPPACPLPKPVYSDLPRWRGFNLQAKYHKEWTNEPFEEKNFRIISELGFNFVRLPMDYRIWIVDGDWLEFDEGELLDIDQAIVWGVRHGIHVCLNFHRAPGYTVATPPEPVSLWECQEAQDVFAEHWRMFAERYRGIPNRYLSFNLLNEPARVDEATYIQVMTKAIESIREVDENRLIICDGLDYGRRPVRELAKMEVAQSTRGYYPHNISHYRAPWVDRSETWPVPVWQGGSASGYLYGPNRPELHKPLVIKGEEEQVETLILEVMKVSDNAVISINIDHSPEFTKKINPGQDSTFRTDVEFKEEWGIYQADYDRLPIEIPVHDKFSKITVWLESGDWVLLSGLSVVSYSGEKFDYGLENQWGLHSPVLRYSPESGSNGMFQLKDFKGRERLWAESVEPWLRHGQEHNFSVLVGEWGAYKYTPHEVMLAWAEDNLRNWKEAGWGWALWDFKGPFGIFNSEREDVDYEKYQGYKLDRKFLELLQRY